MNNLRRKSLSTCGSISVEESLEVKSFGQSEQACVILIDIAKFPSGGGGLLTPPQQYLTAPHLSHILATSELLNSLSAAKRSGTDWHLTVVWICISLILRKDVYLFMCLRVTCISFSVTWFVSVAMFFFWVVFFLFLSRNILCLRKINSSSVICRTNVSPVCHLPSLSPLKKTTNIWSITYTAKCAVWWIVTKQATCVTFRLSLFVSRELLPREAFYFHIIEFINLLFYDF